MWLRCEPQEKIPVRSWVYAALRDDKLVVKLDRALYMLREYEEPIPEQASEATNETPMDQSFNAEQESQQNREEHFYESFASFLKEVEEATSACALGGRVLKDKWGTPDVIGVYRAAKFDVVQFEQQTISSEIKINENEALTALGQAMAYCLFSHKSYIGLPRTMRRKISVAWKPYAQGSELVWRTLT